MAEGLKLILGAETKQAEQALKNFSGTLSKLERDVLSFGGGVKSFSNNFNRSFQVLPSAIKRTDVALQKLSRSSINTTQATVNFGRVLQDLPYGIQGVANNIDPLVASLGGPAGLGIAVTLVTTGLLVFGNAIASVLNPTNKLNESFKGSVDNFKAAASTVTLLKNEVQLAKDGFIDKNKVVEHYNETMGKTAGIVKTLDEVEQQLTKNGDAYIRMTLLKAAANIALGKAAEKAFDAELARRKEAEKFLTVGDKLTSFGAGGVSAPGFVPNLQTQATQTQIAFDKEQSEKRKKAAIDNAKKEQKTFEDIAADLLKEAGKISKDFNFNFFDDTKIEKVKSQKERLEEFVERAKRLAEELRKIGFIQPEFSFFDSFQEQLVKARKVFDDFNAKRFRLDPEFFKLDQSFNVPRAEVEQALNAVEDGIQKGIIERGGIQLVAPISITTDFSQNAALVDEFKTAFAAIGKNIPPLDFSATAGFNRGVLVQQLRDFFKVGQNVTEEGVIGMAQEFEKGMDRINSTLSNFAVQGVTSFAESFGALFAGGDLRDIFSGFVNVVADGLSAIGKQMIALSPVITALKAALKSLNPSVLLPAGIALVSIGAALRATVGKGVTGFAQGGLVFGPTMGLVGEGIGTSRSNPEVIAPLDQLKGMLSEFVGGGVQRVHVTGRLRGRDMALQNARTSRSQRRVNG